MFFWFNRQSFVTSEDVVAQRVVTYTGFMIIRSLVLPFPDLFCDLEFALFLSGASQIVVQKNSTRGGALSTCWTSREGTLFLLASCIVWQIWERFDDCLICAFSFTFSQKKFVLAL